MALVFNPAFDQDHANVLATDIKNYWLDRGFNIETYVRKTPLGHDDGRRCLAIRTNLDHRGLPPSHPGETL
jgi:hypothetical protein